jgi:hypothetical protein
MKIEQALIAAITAVAGLNITIVGLTGGLLRPEGLLSLFG